jgi:hypothetical protein
MNVKPYWSGRKQYVGLQRLIITEYILNRCHIFKALSLEESLNVNIAGECTIIRGSKGVRNFRLK